jgi:hypothetical protein
MSFQWIIDNAASISMERKPVVASTTARDGTVRAVSRGNQPWQFEVTVANGIRWTDIRSLISQAEKLDRYTVSNISFNDTGHDWMVRYQGNFPTPTSFSGSWTKGATTITVTGGGSAPASGFRFRAGDFIQLGNTGRVYTVAADVAFNSTSVPLHRPVLENNSSDTLRVGASCVWSVICVQFPKWNLFERDQVSWDGPFIFSENFV